MVVDDHKTFSELLALALAGEPGCECVGTASSAGEALWLAADAGACSLVPKDGALAELMQAVRSARRRRVVVHPVLLRRLLTAHSGRAVDVPALTGRECEVLAMLDEGKDARTIGRRLGSSVNTCRGYVKTWLSKLGARSQLEAVAIATRHGLLHA